MIGGVLTAVFLISALPAGPARDAVPVDVPVDVSGSVPASPGTGVERVEIPRIPADATLAESLAILTDAGLPAGALGSAMAGLFERTDATGDELARGRLIAADAAARAELLELAVAHLREADRSAAHRSLRALARFNLGQLEYARAMSALVSEEASGSPTPDFDGSIGHLRRSAEGFRSVLDVDPTDGEAARNVERVRRMIDRIDQIKQQAQAQADKLREQADALDDLADKQQQESIENDQQAQPEDEAKRDQEDLSEQTEQQSEQMDNEQQAGEEARRRLDEAREKQREAEDALERGDEQGASDAQREAAEKLREAARELREQADNAEGERQEPQGEPSDQEQGDQGGEQDGESQDDRLAQWLLDREQQHREQRDRQMRSQRGRPRSVEKDW